VLTLECRTEAASMLVAAERDRSPIDPLTQRWPDLDVADAYEIQRLNIAQREHDGRRIVGHKVGLSSKAMQEMMGVDEPDFGHLLDDMEIPDGAAIAAAAYCAPRIEVEVAFHLGADLPTSGCTLDDVLAATEGVSASIELIDSRIADWKIRLPDTIADNASSGGFVLGPTRRPISDLDICGIDAELRRNGETVATGRSSAVLGNPLIAVAWLANTVGRFGVPLQAGQVVLPGSCTRAFDAAPGDVFRAAFDGLGEVSVSFT
jgi:2-keto-4-pentenoate hydratase